MSQEDLINAIREELRQHRYESLRPSRGMAQSDVYQVEVNGTKAVIKDFSQRGFIARHLLCRAIIKREIRALKALEDTGRVPAIYGQLSPDCLVIEHIAGVSPGRNNAGRWPEAFAQTADFLAEMHARGFAHNDFRRDNLMIEEDGLVRFFDFASALRQPQSYHFVLCPVTLLVKFMQRMDRIGLMKMKADLTGQPLTEEEQRLGQKPRLIRALRDFWKRYINKAILHRLK